MLIKETEQGINKHTLYLKEILDENSNFEKNWDEFYKSDKLNPKIFSKKKNELRYLCDHHVPEKKDERYPLFLLFGNSTPHSIEGKLYFAYEGNKREHRMWKLFKELEILDFGLDDTLSLSEKNLYRKKAIFELLYNSPFRVAMDVFISIPSTPSRPPWSGVAGVQKLLGAKALRKLIEFEQERLSERINKFIGDKGAIIAFQKDAYNGIITKDSPKYSLDNAIKGTLQGTCLPNKNIKVYGVAPTRWLNGGQARKTLKNLIIRLRD